MASFLSNSIPLLAQVFACSSSTPAITSNLTVCFSKVESNFSASSLWYAVVSGKNVPGPSAYKALWSVSFISSITKILNGKSYPFANKSAACLLNSSKLFNDVNFSKSALIGSACSLFLLSKSIANL